MSLVTSVLGHRVCYKTLAMVTTGHYTLRKTSHQGENSACVALAGAGHVGNGMQSVLLETSPATAPTTGLQHSRVGNGFPCVCW